MLFTWLKIGFLIASVLSALLIAGCGGGAGDTGATLPESSSKSRNLTPVAAQATENTVINAINSFGLDMLGSITGNAVVAPFSASLSLAKLRAGAKGDTLTAINQVMRLEGVSANVDSAFNGLDLNVNARIGTSTLGSLSSEAKAGGWDQARYGYLLTYLDLLAQDYGLKPIRTDFALALGNAEQALTDWASLASGGLPASATITQDTRFVLGDAVRFNAAWADPFDSALTTTGWFKPLDSQAVERTFMRKSAILPYTSGDGYTAVELPLVGGQRFLVIMPNEGSYTEIQTALTAERLNQIVAALAPTQVDLALPRFAFENIKELSLGVASSKGVADFSGLDGTKDLYVSSAGHHSRLSVAETGIQAGSATLLALDDLHPETWPEGYNGGDCILSEDTIYSAPNVSLIMGRPFLFAVRDSVTGALLFMGRVLNPNL